MKDHKGFTSVYSELGKGTTFEVYLPTVKHEEVLQPDRQKVALASGHGELILVVDDEQAILEITREILEVSGYRVLTASNGRDAVSVFSNAIRGSVRLILTDVNMPGMDGYATIKAIRKLDSNVKVVIASGLVSDLDVQSKDLLVQGYLTKPYSSERMLTVVHELLGS